MVDVSTMTHDQLTALVALAYEGWTGDCELVFTGSAAEARAELDRRSGAGEIAFKAMLDRHGGEAAFDYEVRDPVDGMVGHAFDLICDQFFHEDNACGGDYAAAEARAMACLAGMERVLSSNESPTVWTVEFMDGGRWYLNGHRGTVESARAEATRVAALPGVDMVRVVTWAEAIARASA